MTLAWIALGLALWLVASLPVGVVLGRMLKERP